MMMVRKASGMISLREPYTRKLNGGPKPHQKFPEKVRAIGEAISRQQACSKHLSIRSGQPYPTRSETRSLATLSQPVAPDSRNLSVARVGASTRDHIRRISDLVRVCRI